MATISLRREGNPLARASEQLKLLSPTSRHKPFTESLVESGLHPLEATGIEVLQVNVGKLCNMTCKHCHVDAGPDRREMMTRRTMQDCLDVLAKTDIPVLDVTGGAPEMNPNFRWLVRQARGLDRRVIDRSNLTILLAPGFDDLPHFLAELGVEIVASLPCYLQQNVDAQRGSGAFEKSLRALRLLNSLGYGRPGTGLNLSLVYNPLGATLPPPQEELEEAYRRELKNRYDIVFNRLLTITNLPISRFLDQLIRTGQYEQYMEKLASAFNPAAAKGVMCRTMLSVDWQGRLYDCDFNQILELGLEPGLPRHIRDFDFAQLARRRIVCSEHCYGCTAGAGSSCHGAIVER